MGRVVMIKLIATDMDGTLLNSKNEIQDGFYEVFNKLEEESIPSDNNICRPDQDVS